MFINPTVQTDSNVIHIRTSLLERLFLLYCFDKKIEVNRSHRFIKIDSKFLWFFNSNKNISFDRIDDLETKSFVEKSNSGMVRVTYSIILCLKDPREKFTLINFKDGFSSAKDDFSDFFDLLMKYIKR